MRLSITAKTTIGTALIEGVLLLMLVITATHFMGNIANDNLVKRASTASKLFAATTKSAVLSLDLASLDAITDEVLTNPDIVYAKVFDVDGRLLAAAGNLSLLNRPFVEDVLVDDVNDGVYDKMSPIFAGDQTYGRVELGISISEMQETMTKVKTWTASIAFVEMLLVGLFSIFLGRYLTKQLNVLRRGAKKINAALDSGQFDVARVPEDSHDELAEVAKAFNSLVDNLEVEYQRTQSFQNALQGLNRTLEMKVKKRTQQVEAQNEELTHINQNLKSTQQQLLQAEKMASVGQLAAGVAHEINNPIGFINSNMGVLKGYIDTYIEISLKLETLVKMPTDDDNYQKTLDEFKAYLDEQDISFINDDVKELLVDTDDGLSRVIDIVKNMKSFSRADSDTMQLFDINQCISTTAKMVKSKVTQNAELVLDLKDVPDSFMNVGKINQVLTNLIVNAGQAIQKDGTVTVHSFQDGDNIKIMIVDTGTGMSAEIMKDIFNPFFTTKDEGEGTGLGLSISFDIIQEHGGSIAVESEIGVGTRFTITLPIVSSMNSDSSQIESSIT
jgi:signal transduction histidine kinase